MKFTLVYLTPPNDISKVKTRGYSEVSKLQDEFDNRGTIGWLTAPRVEGTLQPLSRIPGTPDAENILV